MEDLGQEVMIEVEVDVSGDIQLFFPHNVCCKKGATERHRIEVEKK